MKTEDFNLLCGILQGDNIHRVHLYMSGEPTHHPDFYGLLRIARQHGIAPNVASKLPIPIKTDLIPHGVTFEVTIDSLSQNDQSRIAPGIDTAIVLENIRRLSGKFPIMATTVVNRYNERSLSNIGSFMKTIGVPWHPKAMGCYMMNKMDNEAIKIISDLMPIGKQWNSRFAIKEGKLVSLVKRCPFHDPAIGPTGDVTICCHDMLFEFKCGNVFETRSLIKTLTSERFVSVRKSGNRMALSICKGCN